MNEQQRAAAATVAELPGLKEAELIKLGPCRVCGQQQLAGGEPTFYIVELSRAMFDRRSIERRVGLEMMLGSGPLAKVMGPDEDIAKVFDGPHRVFVHETCALRVHHLLELVPEPAKDEGADR